MSLSEAMLEKSKLRRILQRAALLAIFTAAMLSTTTAQAQTTYTWNDSTSSWTTSTAWTPNGPADWTSTQRFTDTMASFGSQASIANQPVLDGVSNVNVGGISFDDSDAVWDLSGGTSLNIGSGGVALTGAGTNTTVLSASTNLSFPQTWAIGQGLTLEVTNTLGGLAGYSDLTKAGPGTLSLSNNSNTYSGAITIAGGTLSVTSIANGGVNSALGAGGAAASNLKFDGGTLNYTGAGDSTDRLFTISPNGATILGNGTNPLKFTSTAGLAYSGSGARTLTLGGDAFGINNLAASIADGPGGATSIVKSDSGYWALTGVATYTGATTVTNGVLFLGGDRSAATGPVVDAGGRIVVLDHTIIGGDVTIANETGFQASQGGTAATQTNSPQFFGDSEAATVRGSMTMEVGAIVEFEIQGHDPDTGYDQVEVDKNVIINGACLDLVVDGYTPTAGEPFFIINNKGDNPIEGQFTNAQEGSIITADGQSFMVTYSADFDTGSTTGGNDLALVAVPEPATFTLFGLAILLFGGFRLLRR